MSVKTTRICDVCQAEYTEEIVSWMIINTPNSPIEGEYDICSWPCLTSFVGDDDDEPAAPAQPDLAKEIATPEAQEKLDKAMAELEARMANTPPMSLAEAIASGKLDFTRGPE